MQIDNTQVHVIMSNCAIRNLWNVMLKQKSKHNKNLCQRP